MTGTIRGLYYSWVPSKREAVINGWLEHYVKSNKRVVGISGGEWDCKFQYNKKKIAICKYEVNYNNNKT